MNSCSSPAGAKIIKRVGRVLSITIALISLSLLSLTAHAQPRQLDLILSFVSNRYYLEARAGEANNYFMEVNNIGNQTLTDIKLSSEQPEGWIVDFEPSRISSLGAGTLQTVDVTITPPQNTTRGEKEITVIAEANELRKVQKVWVTIKLASAWVWVGVGGILVIVVAFILVYLRFGRHRTAT